MYTGAVLATVPLPFVLLYLDLYHMIQWQRHSCTAV